MGAAQTGKYVDRRYEDRDVNELPEAPVEALRGLGKRGGEALHKAFGVKTIRDLATNDFVLKAQELIRLAEGPAAIPTAAPAAAAAGADAADQRRAQAGQQALTRSEEELEVDTKQVPRGQAGVRKRVVTEQQHRTVPVEREELRVQREPIRAGEGDGGDAEITADERTIELREEQPVVDKRVVPKERVRIGKEVVRDQEQVSEPVRKEQVEVEQPDGER
jgi:uncharacterized protein (TIGR02271 family)